MRRANRHSQELVGLEGLYTTHRLRRCSEIWIKVLYNKIRSWRMDIAESAEQFARKSSGRVCARQIHLLMEFRVL